MSAEPRRRGPRRADVPGTGPADADGPEPRVAGLDGGPAAAVTVSRAPGAPGRATAVQVTPPGGSPAAAVPADAPAPAVRGERDRWLLEQRPPHWG